MLKLINNDRFSEKDNLEENFCKIYDKLINIDIKWQDNIELVDLYVKQNKSELSESELNKAIETYSEILDDIEHQRQSKISYDLEAYGDTFVQNTNQYCC